MITVFFLFGLNNLVNAQSCTISTVNSAVQLKDITSSLAKPSIVSTLKTLDPCTGMQFFEPEIVQSLCNVPFGMIQTGKEIEAEKLKVVASEIIRPNMFNKHYHGHLNRTELSDAMMKIYERLKTDGLTRFKCDDLIQASVSRYSDAQVSKEIGECYMIQTFGGFKYVFGYRRRPVSIPADQQKIIEDLFSSPKEKPYHLDLIESELVQNNRLTINDLKELKAIRKASQIFEQQTPLKNDEAGGFISNFKGEIAGGDQLNCVAEAHTHKNFLEKLVNKGLIKNFEIVKVIERYPNVSNFKKEIDFGGHAAVLLKSKSTGQEVVYDSWFEAGGKPAHIMLKEDWDQLKLTGKNNFKDIVTLD